MTEKIEHFRVDSILNRDFNTTENVNEFRVVQLYLNNTPDDVCVVHRNNLPIILKRSNSYFGGIGNFTIRTIYHFNSKEQIVNAINNLALVAKDSQIQNNELEIIRTALLEGFNSRHGEIKLYSVAIDKEVPIKKIKQHRAIYIHEADVVICDPRAMTRCLHPYSEEGMINNNYREFVEQRKVSGVFVELIDNENKIHTRYMYVAKKLVEVPARVDKSKKSGVYFTTAEYDHMDEVHINPEYYSAAEAEDILGLHRTAEEAMTGGDPSSLSKIAEDKAKSEYLELKRKTDLERIENERRANADQERLRLLEAQINENKLNRTDMYEERKTKRADYYDERSTERKDNSELWKYISAACITGLTVYAATTKANSKH